MKQTLKISIVRGGCRFATPLYLGGEYALTFEGERADEAKTLLVTRPQKDRDGNLIALAKSETSNDGGVSLFLNRQALVDWFGACRAEDVDATVDAHVYVFDADSVVIADSDVTIEYRPVDFVVSDKEFEKWSNHEDRIEVLEDASKSHDAAIADHETEIADLHKADEKVAGDAAIDATTKADAALADAKIYADKLYVALAKMEYVYDEDASTEEKAKFRRVTSAKNSFGERVLTVSEELYDHKESEIKDTFMYTDSAQVVTGEKTFEGQPYVPTLESTDDSSRKAASTGWVTKKLAAWWTTIKAAFLASDNTWKGSNAFERDIVGHATGDLPLTAGKLFPVEGPLYINGSGIRNYKSGGEVYVSGSLSIAPGIHLFSPTSDEHSGAVCIVSSLDTAASYYGYSPDKFIVWVKPDGTLTCEQSASGVSLGAKNILRSADAAEVVVLSEAEYKALKTKDANTIYMVKES